jgi:hypothetical protein
MMTAGPRLDGSGITLRIENQQNAVADEVSAITAVVRPVLEGLFYGLSETVVQAAGGRQTLTVAMMARIYRPGDGDVGICFEYAVHDAMNRGDGRVVERVAAALGLCRVPGNAHSSILFGAEKSGALNLIETARERLTDESRVLTGQQAQPPKLKRYIRTLAAALRRPAVRSGLPYSISGLWKADLFLGNTDRDRWVGTTVKVNRTMLEAAPGLRIGIIPMDQGRSDAVRLDEQRNLVVCPLPYDASFVQTFYEAWEVVKFFIKADAHVPSPAMLPRPASRQVARYLEDRREYSVLDVIDALEVLSQPELLRTEEHDADTVSQTTANTTDETVEATVDTVIAPRAREI